MKMAHLQHQQQQQQPSNEHFESELNFPSKKLHEIFRLKFKEKRTLALNMAQILFELGNLTTSTSSHNSISIEKMRLADYG